MKLPIQYSPAEIQNKHHLLMLNYRGQDRVIQSEIFREAWGRADEKERKWVLNLFLNPDAYKLKRWVLHTMVGGLEQYPMGILRQIASYHKIGNYSRLSKLQLLDALTMKGIINGGKNSRGNNK